MALTAVTSLLEQVKEVVILYKDLISGSEDEFKLLQDNLSVMKDLLEYKANESDLIRREQEKRIRDDIYEMQEAIDICLSNALQAKSLRRPTLLKKRFSLAEEVKLIRQRKLRPLLVSVRDWEKLPGGSEDSLITEHRKDVPIRQSRVVGFDDEEAMIVNEYLLKESDHLGVIPIIGAPGQGKTKLAWKIYQSDNVGYHFPIRIWIYVSQKFNIRDVFIQILRKIVPSLDMDYLDLGELADTVRMVLRKEQFLLVLDDIWSVEAWNEIKVVLPLSDGKSKVLLTSRDNHVGEYSASRGKPHNLRLLTDEESWTLLQYEVFGRLNECPPELAEIGEKIALKCHGLPLTIVVIGGILIDSGYRCKAWEKVSKSVSDAIQNDENMGQRVTDVIKWSYDILPYYMRVCFVYLGIFPEDYEVPVQMLLRLWIAEGFIEPKLGWSLEECGEEILNDLIRRNLLKAEKSNHMGRVKSCRVHDMVRAFCISKSREQNLFTEINLSDRTGKFPDVRKARRLCSSSDPSRFLLEFPQCSNTRSYLSFYKIYNTHYSTVLPRCFPRLRILESTSHQFPVTFTKLIHLRYLTLFIDELASLPESISQLWNLQTLVVQTKTRSITMKANVWRMFQLRHLKSNAAIVLDSKWDGEARQNLQTLNRLSPDSCTESVTKSAKNLKALGISGDLTNIFKTKFLENLLKLEKLKLVSIRVYESTFGPMLPGLNGFPPNLKRLTLANTFLEWKHMQILAEIRNLEVLKLKDNAFTGFYWDAMNDRFPNLQLLIIVNMDFVLWTASSESLPSLKCLVLKNCENLVQIPETLAKTLQKLDIERLRRSAVDSANKIAEIKRAGEHGTSKSACPFTLNTGSVYLG